jgi:hypothetical protein
VNRTDLGQLLEQYRRGLEAEIALLRQLDAVAGRQREKTETRDFEQLAAASDERERLTRSLVRIEEGLRATRNSLSRGGRAINALPGFAHVVELRRTAADLVNRILETDKDSMKALSDAELARRAAVASLERGENTLAAYRKVLTPPVSNATLVNQRG